MEMLITISVVVGVLLLGFVVVPFLRKKGWLNKTDVETAQQIIMLTELVMSKIKFKNGDIQNNLTLVFDITNIASDCVGRLIDINNIADKKALAKEVSYKVLNELKIEVDDKTKRLIDTGIDLAVDKLNKQ